MSNKKEVRYESRTVRDWIQAALDGTIAITDFQRSFVWRSDKAENYIKAIMEGKPVGLYLILETASTPQFKPRNFHQMEIPLENVSELVLDGQQRLTALVHALSGQSEKRYFIELTDIASEHLKIENIQTEAVNSPQERTYRDASAAYSNNLIPMDVLSRQSRKDGLDPLAHWCIALGDHIGVNASRILESKINRFIDDHFFNRSIWFCWLPASIDRKSATEIFVETNTSSVRIKRFDIEVANIRGDHDEDLRNSISQSYQKLENAAIRHYFKEDPEDWIPDIGEWMFKVLCVRSGHAPSEQNYAHGISILLQDEQSKLAEKFEGLFRDLVWAVEWIAALGACTRRTLPSWPPVHVIAAIRPEFEVLRDPTKYDIARKLLIAYYWRCLFSSRHDEHANTRLLKDYRELKCALEEIRAKGTWEGKQAAFNKEDHPLHDSKYLLRNSRWIGGTSRIGRAIASIVSSRNPVDWITGDTLDSKKIRELERAGDLDRHHVFSRDALRNAGEEKDRINNGLNGVYLDGKTNRRLAKDPPEVYLKKVVETSQISEKELKERVEQHIVPYDEMNGSNRLKKRYDDFLKKRSIELAQCIADLAKDPRQ